MGNDDQLLTQLERQWRVRQKKVAKKWKRTLGFGDYVVDRWEKARCLGFGDGASIYDSAIVLGDVSVGKNTWIGPFAVLDGSGGLVIGDYCSISAGVQVYSHDSVAWAATGGEAAYEYAETRIGDRCYIGPNAVISRGVTIGDGCVIGANSLVLKSVQAGKKAFGTPCKVVGDVDVNEGE